MRASAMHMEQLHRGWPSNRCFWSSGNQQSDQVMHGGACVLQNSGKRDGQVPAYRCGATLCIPAFSISSIFSGISSSQISFYYRPSIDYFRPAMEPAERPGHAWWCVCSPKLREEGRPGASIPLRGRFPLQQRRSSPLLSAFPPFRSLPYSLAFPLARFLSIMVMHGGACVLQNSGKRDGQVPAYRCGEGSQDKGGFTTTLCIPAFSISSIFSGISSSQISFYYRPSIDYAWWCVCSPKLREEGRPGASIPLRGRFPR
jgi:hypothetical protein